MRVGWGIDAHRLTGDGRVLLAGIVAGEASGVAATSDGDVAAHAVIDAVLGAAALGDIGELFPPDDPASVGADSMVMLRQVVARVMEQGFRVHSVDVTIVAEDVRVAPVRAAMRAALAAALQVGLDGVSVKGTTTDGMGFMGRGEGLTAMAVAVLGDF